MAQIDRDANPIPHRHVEGTSGAFIVSRSSAPPQWPGQCTRHAQTGDDRHAPQSQDHMFLHARLSIPLLYKPEVPPLEMRGITAKNEALEPLGVT